MRDDDGPSAREGDASAEVGASSARAGAERRATSDARVLVVDDEAALRRSLARLLLSHGFHVLTAEDGPSALALVDTSPIDVVLADLRMPGMSGLDLLEALKAKHPSVEVVLMTAFGDVDTAVSAVRAGAYDFLTKPFPSNDAVPHVLARAAEHKRLVDRTRQLEQRLEEHESFGELKSASPEMKEVYRRAVGAAPSVSTVLLLGENGTGKELLAREIHKHSLRANRPLFPINCGAIPETLVESELFGAVRGAFTGAQDRAGLFEQADGATVFLDEIGDLPPTAQVKLLRVLGEGEIKRVGANDTRLVDVRVLAATNVDLKERIAAGRFREDLYYRLAVIPIHLPPLRQRKEDIPLLAYHFLDKLTRRAGHGPRRIGPEALRLLRDHPWPGNVRELENAIEHAVVMARGESITPSDLPFSRAHTKLVEGESVIVTAEVGELSYVTAKNRALDAFERAYVDALLRRTEGNVSESARIAGMDRSNFRRLLRRVRGAKR